MGLDVSYEKRNHIKKEIGRAIKVMKDGKAADVVGVTAKAIKDSINRSAELLHKLFSNLGGRINTSRLERRIPGDAVKERGPARMWQLQRNNLIVSFWENIQQDHVILERL